MPEQTELRCAATRHQLEQLIGGAARLGVAVASLWVNLVPFFAVLWSMTYGFMPNAFQIAGGLVALSGVLYMQWRKLAVTQPA